MESEKTEGKMREDIRFVREFAPGYLGGQKMANEATNDEIEYIIILNHQIAELSSSLTATKQMRKNIFSGISSRIVAKCQGGGKRGKSC